MLVSVRWLEELLATKLKISDLKKTCLDFGLEIMAETKLAPEGVMIGRIDKIARHPSMKSLEVLTIRTKQEIQIVSAAKNVKEQDLVLVGPAGIVFNGQKVSPKDFEGVVSQGILISEQELGLAEKSLGVIVLAKGVFGAAFETFFDDIVVDIKTTPNRPDWLSMQGLARELGVGLGVRKSKLLNLDIKQFSQFGDFKIRIEDPQGCPRYTARIFEDVVVGESPFDVKWRLHCMGMNPINNVVDITNILLLLTGQPLHPFDLDLLKGGIVVRKAHKNEEFVTLEGTVLKLDKNDLVIADHQCPIALAGVIGGRQSQISHTTKRVLLESAYFDRNRVAHTARRLAVVTEAAIRFERGADIWAADAVSAMAAEQFKSLAQAKEVGFVAAGKKGKALKVRFSIRRLNEILALNLKEPKLKSMLKKIDIEVTGKKVVAAKIPHYRRDLQLEEDIYEEVARLYGYMRIPDTLPKKWAGKASVNKDLFNEETLKNYLVGQGFSETYNLSLMSSKRLLDFGWENFVRVRNPLNERFDALRPVLFFGLVDCVNYNLAKGNRSLKLFEVGNILLSEPPFEEKRLGLIMGGERYPDFWNQENERLDYFDDKGIVESILSYFHIKDVVFRPTTKIGLREPLSIFLSGRELGYLGRLDAELCREPYFYAELSLPPIWSCLLETFYIPPAKYPANTRDLSFLVEEGVEVPEILDLIVKSSGPILEKINLFDYYKGDNLPSGKKSLGFRLYFKAPDRTLTDKEVDTFVDKIAGDVIQQFKASLRTKEQNWKN